MLRRPFVLAALCTLALATTGATRVIAKWPPWISIESPVNPYDPSSRGAAFLVHAMVREGTPTVRDVSASAEGLVNGARRSIALRIDSTSRPGIFAVRRQWPADGAWVVRVNLFTTSAIVSLDSAGNVAGTFIPTHEQSGLQLPRPVAAREVESMLAALARR